MLLVAVITVDAASLDEYRTYERTAAQIMARYGGKIERALVMPGLAGAAPAPAPPPAAKRGGIMGALEEMGTGIDRGLEKLLHPNDQAQGTFRELHIVSFPDDAAYEAYRVDAEHAQHAATRARCVRSTEIWRAEEGPRY